MGEIPMKITVRAVYENGVLRPVEPLALPEGESVAVTIDAAIAATKRAGWTRDVFRLILDLRSIQWRCFLQI